jgi:antirestriction protein ArdC
MANSTASKSDQQETLSRNKLLFALSRRLRLAILAHVSPSPSPGGNVRKGEHGTKIVFWKFDKYETETADGETEERKSAFLRYYTVFNLEQTEGLKALLVLPPARPIESAEAIVSGMPSPPTFEQGFRASYAPSTDTVTMPSRTAYDSQAEYYSTLFHELTHSTGHAKRLAREGFDRPQLSPASLTPARS